MFDPTLVHDYLRLSADLYPEKEALICGEERWTYQAIDSSSRRVGGKLMELGVERHDRVVIFLDNSSESIISLYGTLMAGATFVMLNGTVKAQKLNYILRDSGAKVLITVTSKKKVVLDALADLSIPCEILWVGEPSDIPENLSGRSHFWDTLFPGMEKHTGETQPIEGNFELPLAIDQDLAALIYTSGSTGEPKGVMSTHRNMVSAAKSIVQYLENRSDDIVMNVLPLSFDYGLYQVIMAFMFGGTVVLEKSFLYPIKILEQIENEKVTGFPIVPTIVAFLLKMESMNRFDLSSLRYMSNTGAALPADHIRRLRELFPDVRLYSMFGLTECKRVSFLPPEEIDRRPTSVGKAMPNCEVIIVDGHGNEVEPGEVGELIVRGSNVMPGYWNAPELSTMVYRNGRHPGDRVLYSGDYFRKDDEGYLYFLGRKDDMIKTKGERVGPKEVENVLCQMENVAEAAVVGVPDEILGQAVKAYIVCRPGTSLTEREVLNHCSSNLEIFMIPKFLQFIDELPKTPHGKIDKTALVRIFEQT